MKVYIFIFISLSNFITNAQFYKTHNWYEEISNDQIFNKYKDKESIGLFDKYYVEYFALSDSLSYEKYLTRHTQIKIIDSSAIKNHELIYIPLNDVIEISDIKVRIINNDSITQLNSSNLKELENELISKNFKIYLIEGITENAILEYMYTVKQVPDTHGSQTLQENHFVIDTEFILIPGNRKTRVKAYNTSNSFNSELLNNIAVKKIKLKNTKPLKVEEYSNRQANRINIVYQCFKENNKLSQNDYWANISESIHPIVFKNINKISKSIIDLNKIIFTEDKNAKIATQNIKFNFNKLNLIDDFVKENFEIIENGDKNLSNLEYILKNKKASKFGIIQVYSNLFSLNDIKYELVITSNRYFNKFDPDFFNPDNLRELLFYFPSEKKYIASDISEHRIGEAPFNLLGNYGMFIEKNKNFYFSPILENDRSYSEIKRNIKIKFKKLEQVIIKETQSFTGHWATTNRAILNQSQDLDQNAFKDYLTTSGIEDKSIIDYSTKNEKLFQPIYNTPFIVNSEIASKLLISKQGKNYYNFQLGKILGIQSELYDEIERENMIDIKYPNSYSYDINIQLPKGYKVNGLEKIKMDKKFKSVNGNIEARFMSNYQILKIKNKKYLNININEFYNSISYNIYKYKDFRNVINAAADFNKIEIELVKN